MPTYQTDGSGDRVAVSLTETPAAPMPETPAAPAPVAGETPVASAPTDETPDTSEDLEGVELSSPQGRNRLQRRFDRLTARQREKDREIAELRSQQAAMMQLLAERQQPPAPAPDPAPRVPATADHPPRPEDYPTHEAFMRACGRWEAQQLFAERDRQQEVQTEQQRQQTEQSAVAQRWQTSRAAAIAIHADFDDVLARTDVRISSAAEAAVLSSDQAAQLVYHLAIHPEEAARLNALPPLVVAREVGKLEAALSRPAPSPTPSLPAPSPRPQAQPLTPVSQAGTPQATLPLDQMSYRDYQRARDRG